MTLAGIKRVVESRPEPLPVACGAFPIRPIEAKFYNAVQCFGATPMKDQLVALTVTRKRGFVGVELRLESRVVDLFNLHKAVELILIALSPRGLDD